MIRKILLCQSYNKETMDKPDFLCSFILIFEPNQGILQAIGDVYKRNDELILETGSFHITNETIINQIHMVVRNNIVPKEKLPSFDQVYERAEHIICSQLSDEEIDSFLARHDENVDVRQCAFEDEPEEYQKEYVKSKAEQDTINQEVNERWNKN